MRIYLTIIIVNITFSQGNYQILSVPSNFENFFEITQFNKTQNYSIFNLSFPNNINLFSATVSNPHLNIKGRQDFYITITNLNYGNLLDSQNNYHFTASESLIKFGLYKKIRLLDIIISFGYLKSNIDIYQSDAIYCDLNLFVFISKKHTFDIFFKNFGRELNPYLNHTTQLPKTISLSYKMSNLIFPIIFYANYEYRLDQKKEVLNLTLKFNMNKNLKIYLSNRSDRANLFFGDYIEKLMAGTSIGMMYNNNSNSFSLGIQNLGPAGYSTAISFSKTIL